MKNIKQDIKAAFPKLTEIYHEMRHKIEIKVNKRSNEYIFEKIYKKNFWESNESISGPGSALKSTINFHDSFIKLLKDYNIKVMLDAPCGDFNWMKELNLPLEKYIGVDIVEDLINNNITKYKSKNLSFEKLDITKDELPKVDLIFCRDCLVHLSLERIFMALKNFKKSGSKYLLTTTYINAEKNIEIVTGNWRKLNLTIEPFNFREPLTSIYEDCPVEGANGKLSTDKYLFLWEINTLNT